MGTGIGREAARPRGPLRLGAVGLVAAALLGGCGAPSVRDPNPVSRDADIVDRGAPPLTSAEIRLYLRDSTLSHEGKTRIWHVHLRGDGSMAGVGIGKEDRSADRASGRWEVRPEGLFCREWFNDWGGGLEGCAEVFRFGDEYLFVEQTEAALEDVRAEFRRKRRAGNPEKL